ncbi:MAG: DUF4375 domain-containing protein [Rubrivivax sp.]
MQRLLCTRCGDSIHPDTAARNNGLCMPCVRGNQLTIEQRNEQQLKRREEERAYRESPEYRYWHSLVKRVYDEAGGFDALAHGDRLYFLINVLSGEVHNGGFDQFFSNSSGDRYAETLAALSEVGDDATLQLLREAKNALFGTKDVPPDRAARFRQMATSSPDSSQCESANELLDGLDGLFHARADEIGAVLSGIASRYRLYGGST